MDLHLDKLKHYNISDLCSDSAFEDHIQRLEQNPTEQEFEIRRRLKLAKPGEKIYIIEPGPKK